MRRFISKNFGLSPQDPAYDHDYNEEEDLENYWDAAEAKGDFERENG